MKKLICMLLLSAVITIYADDNKKNIEKPNLPKEIQNITNKVTTYTYPSFKIKKGIPVRWNLVASMMDLNSCNNRLVIPELGIRKELSPGNNIIEFTVDKAGDIKYFCWMGMRRGVITVE